MNEILMKRYSSIALLALVVWTVLPPERVSARQKEVKKYICPIYCTDDVSDKPRRCAVCKRALEDREIVENPSDYKFIDPHAAFEQMQNNSDDISPCHLFID